MSRITEKEIGAIVQEYQEHLAGWRVVGNDTLVRVSGPVAQAIWFDRLRTGAYRPTARIHILSAPSGLGGSVVLPQFLGVKVRQVASQEHRRQLPNVIAALFAEVLPPINEPLDASAVVELAASQSKGRPAGAYAVACLFAALGQNADARRWIGEYHAAIRGLGLPEQPIDASRSTFLSQLEVWLDKSTSTKELAGVVDREKARLLSGV